MIVMSNNRPRWKLPLAFNIIGSKCDPRLLERMFQGIEAIADQIVVVVDEKAGPSFYHIAREYTDDVYFHPWEDDFALARNRALARTRTPYVAWIDTDEWYRPSFGARIHSLMTRPMGKAYYVWQVSPTANGDTIFVPQIRVFPKVPGVKWEIPIHEQILPSLQRIGVKTQLTDLRVEHAGYLNPATVFRKNRRNLKLLRQEIKRNPADAFTRSNYEKALAYDRHWRHKRRVAP